MFDFGFSEIVLTSAIALVVLGPERLPKVARQVGNWMGKARAMARQLSEQLEREVNADELLREQTKVKPPPPLMNRISQTYIPASEPRTLLPDLHAVSPDNPHEPLQVHDAPMHGHAALSQAHDEHSGGQVPDLHAVAPVEVTEPHTSSDPAHLDARHPPNE